MTIAFLHQILSQHTIPKSESPLTSREVNTLNTQLAELHFKIKLVNETWVLVNLNKDEISKITAYSVPELDFLKSLIQLIVEGNGKIGMTDAINITRSKSANEILIKRFMEDGWFVTEESERSRKLKFGNRLIGELEEYLMNDFDFNKCNDCDKLVMEGNCSCGNTFVKMEAASETGSS